MEIKAGLFLGNSLDIPIEGIKGADSGGAGASFRPLHRIRSAWARGMRRIAGWACNRIYQVDEVMGTLERGVTGLEVFYSK